jgi:MYXO-CTERM domain-containing protein
MTALRPWPALLASLLLAGTAVWSETALAQFCPSYTLSSSSNSKSCAIEAVAGTNPSVAEWQDIFDLVAKGPSAWGDKGPSVSDIIKGCGKPESGVLVAAKFPCELLKAIARAESAWKQFCVPTTPPDQKGGPSRTIISFDCGYGIAQVTSGMHIGETPSYDRERVASNPTYNLATGTRILAAKWKATACVGDKQPSLIEHWYTATWAYNGLAYSNNPNNPNYDANRGIYDPKVGGSRPYQEKVFGRMENNGGLWESTPVAYPRLIDIGNASKPPALPDPSCASPTNCSSTRPLHATVCHPSDGEGGSGGTGGGSGGSGGTGGSSGGSGGTGGSDAATAAVASSGSSLFQNRGVVGDNSGCQCRHAGAPAGPWRSQLHGLILLAVATAFRRRQRHLKPAGRCTKCDQSAGEKRAVDSATAKLC